MEKLFTVQEVADIWGVSTSYVYNKSKAGLLKSLKSMEEGLSVNATTRG
jgi:hypothetical protein